jgi:hypothetical protein
MALVMDFGHSAWDTGKCKTIVEVPDSMKNVLKRAILRSVVARRVW